MGTENLTNILSRKICHSVHSFSIAFWIIKLRFNSKSYMQIAKSLPRICFLSGLSGEEMMMFIDAFPETGIRIYLLLSFFSLSFFFLNLFYFLLSNLNEKTIFVVSYYEQTSNCNSLYITIFFTSLSIAFLVINMNQGVQDFLFHAGLEPAVFAALVPNSADKMLQELIEEIMADHDMMVN